MSEQPGIGDLLALLPVPEEPMRRRILEAAAVVIGERGHRDTTMADIGAAAGCGRATVFRHFGSKQEIVDGVIRLEMRGFAESMLAAAHRDGSPAERVADLFADALRRTRERPMLRRLAEHEPDVLLGFVRGAEPPVLDLARMAVLAGVHEVAPDGPPVDDHFADVLVHLALSYVLVPRSSLDLGDRDQVRTVFGPLIAAAWPGA